MRSVGVLSRVSRPPVLVGGGFLVLTGAILANALFLQSDRHPAPLFETRSAETQADPLVRALQGSLKKAGYYSGPIDGLIGPQTRAAIGAFERATGRLAVGEPTQAVLAALQADEAPASDPVGSSSPASAPAERPAPDGQIAAIQDALAKAAYGPLHADGVLGRQTREAIKRFQRDHDLPVTGEISDALIFELRAAGALEGG